MTTSNRTAAYTAGPPENSTTTGDANLQIVHHDNVAVSQGGNQALGYISQENRAVHRPVDDERGSDLAAAQAGKEVVIFQCPRGTRPNRRVPRRERPRRRTMLVLVPVSSMNTKRAGSRPG